MIDNRSTYIIDFKEVRDDRGYLVSIEENRNIPFKIKRIFYIYSCKNNLTRGNHANKKSKMIFICIKGSCRITVDDGINKKSFFLNNPSRGLFSNSLTWKKLLNFSDDCILLVLSDSYYNEKEYITDYNEFKKILKGNK